jgi:ssDNA-binding Zn-finger/Zn-ribbon topoisomerase 1
MNKLSNGSPCPECGEGKLQRRRRRKWLRWVPASKYYKCRRCRARFLTVWSWVFFLPKKKDLLEAKD